MLATVLKTVGLIVATAVMIYLKCRKAKQISDQKDPSADVQTLFFGRK